MITWKFDCKHFNGWAPCKPYFINRSLCKNCKNYEKIEQRILIIKLEALGDVLRTTPLTKALKKKYPKSQITWLTKKQSYILLKHNPYIDRILFYNKDINRLYTEKFNILINLEKSHNLAALTELIKADKKLGFSINKYGHIYPLNKGAEYYFNICLDNFGLKTKNKKTYQEMIFEIAELKYNREEYILNIPKDKNFINNFKTKNNITNQKIVGMVTGCGPIFPYKKWDTNNFIQLINKLPKEHKIILFGNKNEIKINKKIMNNIKNKNVIDMTNKTNLQQYINLIRICNLLITSDTLGMHIGIALKIPIIAVFGPTPHQEIDLYNRGIKLIGKVPCLNCYNQIPCIQEKQNKPNCMQTITVQEMLDSIKKLL